MAEFYATGVLTLTGVQFTIEADTLDEAQQKAAAGEWSNWDVGGAASQDWKIYPGSVEENK